MVTVNTAPFESAERFERHTEEGIADHSSNLITNVWPGT
jgi:hypothetical protein